MGCAVFCFNSVHFTGTRVKHGPETFDKRALSKLTKEAVNERGKEAITALNWKNSSVNGVYPEK